MQTLTIFLINLCCGSCCILLLATCTAQNPVSHSYHTSRHSSRRLILSADTAPASSFVMDNHSSLLPIRPMPFLGIVAVESFGESATDVRVDEASIYPKLSSTTKSLPTESVDGRYVTSNSNSTFGPLETVVKKKLDGISIPKAFDAKLSPEPLNTYYFTRGLNIEKSSSVPNTYQRPSNGGTGRISPDTEFVDLSDDPLQIQALDEAMPYTIPGPSPVKPPIYPSNGLYSYKTVNQSPHFIHPQIQHSDFPSLTDTLITPSIRTLSLPWDQPLGEISPLANETPSLHSSQPLAHALDESIISPVVLSKPSIVPSILQPIDMYESSEPEPASPAFIDPPVQTLNRPTSPITETLVPSSIQSLSHPLTQPLNEISLPANVLSSPPLIQSLNQTQDEIIRPDTDTISPPIQPVDENDPSLTKPSATAPTQPQVQPSDGIISSVDETLILSPIQPQTRPFDEINPLVNGTTRPSLSQPLFQPSDEMILTDTKAMGQAIVPPLAQPLDETNPSEIDATPSYVQASPKDISSSLPEFPDSEQSTPATISSPQTTANNTSYKVSDFIKNSPLTLTKPKDLQHTDALPSSPNTIGPHNASNGQIVEPQVSPSSTDKEIDTSNTSNPSLATIVDSDGQSRSSVVKSATSNPNDTRISLIDRDKFKVAVESNPPVAVDVGPSLVIPQPESQQEQQDVIIYHPGSPPPASGSTDTKTGSYEAKLTILNIFRTQSTPTTISEEDTTHLIKYVRGEALYENFAADTTQPVVIIGGRHRTTRPDGTIDKLTSWAQLLFIANKYAISALAGITVSFFLFYHYICMDLTLPWRSNVWSVNSWEFVAYIGYLQQLSSISHLDLVKTPYYVLEFTDSFAWIGYIVQTNWGSEPKDISRRLPAVELSGIVSYADRMRIPEDTILYCSVIGFIMILLMLLCFFFMTVLYAKRQSHNASRNGFSQVQKPIIQSRRICMRTLGLCILIWYISMYPLCTYASFELYMQYRAKQMTKAFAIAVIVLILICFGGLALSARHIWHKTESELREFRTLAVWGCLYSELTYRSRMYFVPCALFHMALGVVVGALDTDPGQLMVIILLHVLYLLATFFYSPFADAFVMKIMYSLDCIAIINYMLAYAFLRFSELSFVVRDRVAAIFIIGNSVVILLWSIRQILIFVAYLRAWMARSIAEDARMLQSNVNMNMISSCVHNRV